MDESATNWMPRNLRTGGPAGAFWSLEKKPDVQDFVRNKYRVLLTRARFGTIIFVPSGDWRDPTRDPIEFDRVAAFLRRCGVRDAAV